MVDNHLNTLRINSNIILKYEFEFNSILKVNSYGESYPPLV